MKYLLTATLFFSLSASAQKVSDTLVIKMDTTTYKAVLQLIQDFVIDAPEIMADNTSPAISANGTSAV